MKTPDDIRADQMHRAAAARVARPGYDPEHEHHKAIAARVARHRDEQDTEDFGGAFDGFTVTSDADPGL